MPPRAVLNYVYALLVAGLDRKERDDFDAALNSGVGEATWARVEARAWERLEAGEFDQPGQSDNDDDGGV